MSGPAQRWRRHEDERHRAPRRRFAHDGIACIATVERVGRCGSRSTPRCASSVTRPTASPAACRPSAATSSDSLCPRSKLALRQRMIQAISDVLRANGLHLMIANSGHRLEDERLWWRLAQRVCGLVLHNSTHSKRLREMVAKSDIPVIETGNLPGQPLDMAVSYSNFDAARAMTSHLGRLGYRRIGFVTLPLRDNDRSRERRRGYFAALKDLGFPADRDMVLEAPGGFSEGADALVRLVQTIRYRCRLLRRRRAGRGRAVRMPAAAGRAGTHRHRQLRRSRPVATCRTDGDDAAHSARGHRRRRRALGQPVEGAAGKSRSMSASRSSSVRAAGIFY